MSLFHITTSTDWASAQTAGEYRASSLQVQGFIHLSTAAQWPLTLTRFFRNQTGLILLTIDEAKLKSPLRFEPADGDHFPHLFGPLNLDAVIDVQPL